MIKSGVSTKVLKSVFKNKPASGDFQPNITGRAYQTLYQVWLIPVRALAAANWPAASPRKIM